MPRGTNQENGATEVDDTVADETPKDEPGDTTGTTAEDATETADTSEDVEATEDASKPAEEPAADVPTRKRDWSRIVAYGLLPGIALVLALAAGFLKWQDDSDRTTDINNGDSAASEAMEAAKNSTISMLSYKPDTVEQQLNDARELLTGDFRDSYTSLINDVVIPGAKEKQITAVASVPAVASVSAERNEAVVLVFVNQTVVVGGGAPSDTASSVRVTLEKVDDRWLISEFEPV